MSAAPKAKPTKQQRRLPSDDESEDDDFAIAPRRGGREAAGHAPAPEPGPEPAVPVGGGRPAAGSCSRQSGSSSATVIDLLESDEGED